MLSAPSPLASIVPPPKPERKIKIGSVATHFNISVDLLRLYEREGLLLPVKSAKGTRYYTERDYPWIETLLKLVRDYRLNFAGIRHLLALLPCWDLRHCEGEQRRQCATSAQPNNPCWVSHACCWPDKDCYECKIYRAAPACENMRSMLLTGKGLV
ncbi:MAG: MerR family transcriptional regulator [Candidatus Korobacteraceae bacterium]|jgi:MerR family transcriptional regulator/heat shock protein HspR